MSEQHRFELWQGGLMVAAVESPDKDRALLEAGHYAMIYSQDGPVEIKIKRRRTSMLPLEQRGGK